MKALFIWAFVTGLMHGLLAWYWALPIVEAGCSSGS
jgi:hypothetical protein